MKEMLIYFVRNDLSMVLKLAAGIFLVGHKLPVRKAIWVRLMITFLICICWSGTFYFWGVLDPGSILVRSIIKYLCVFALMVVLVLFCLRTNVLAALFCVTVAYCLEHMSQRISGLFWFNASNVSIGMQNLSLILVAVPLYAILYQLLIRHFLCEEGDDYRDNQILLFLSLVVIGADIILNTLGIHFVFQSANRTPLILIHVFSILCSFLVLVISLCTMRMKLAEKEMLIVEQLLKNERAQFRRDNAVIDTINVKCHDLRHQIAMIKTKLDQKELQDIQEAIQIYDSSVETGNAALNVVLYNKMLLCSGRQIKLTCIADGKQLAFLREADVYSMFSNILDNAIESASKLAEQEKRHITLTVRRENGFVFIHEENYYEGDLIFKNGLPETIKSDKKNHGFGMLSIRTLVEKYQGDLQIKALSNVFKMDIMLPLPKSQVI